jgi:hypothetical protein
MAHGELDDEARALNTIRGLSGLTLLAAVWLFVSPFILGFQWAEGPMINFMLIGGTVAVFAFIRLLRPGRFEPLSVANAFLGLWLILSPFATGYSVLTSATYNSVLIGLVITLAEAGSAYISRRAGLHVPL